MNNHFNHIEDFLEDASFRQWVFRKETFQDQQWEAWCENHPEKMDMVEAAKSLLLAMGEQEQEWEPESQNKVFAAINNIIDAEEEKPVESHLRERLKPRREYTGLKIMVILVVAVVGLVGINLTGIFEETMREEEKMSWIVRTALPGEKKKVHLPDGSDVILNAASEIRYQEGFGQNNREIILKGESYFKVAKDSLLPFRVHGGNLTTEALGTAFNVSAYDGETSKVQLVEGKVKVDQENQKARAQESMILNPGEAVLLSEKGFEKDHFDTNTVLLWTKGTIYFEDTPFPEVVKTLERWYGVKIKTEGQFGKNAKVSGEFHRDNLENVLLSIAYAFQFDFSIENKNVTIQFKKSSTQMKT
ncbi:DUF4974 domain-containing protein [Echinicola jeungdonensis]|uniref:FecR family protein n=1 Tax=Echinicola jeungdonensis TaxID=709343 RepID=A0ABV5J3S6_9BACT|nr:FecR domain-containing protein [Echinicola jeungdonensis]MDN3669345.1 DUF4974 domain-containing protein [Echinicola jeungdonensis]